MSTSTSTTSTTSTSTTTTSTTSTGIQSVGNPLVIAGTGLVRDSARNKNLNIIGWSFIATQDNDSVEVRIVHPNKVGANDFWRATADDVSAHGRVINGPPLAKPLMVSDLQVKQISAGCRLYIYLA